MTVVKISSKQLIECMRCASRCESPKCDDPAIKVVIVDPPNYRTVDPVVGRYRCRHGEFRDFPQTLSAGPPPPVAGFSWWNYEEPGVRRRIVECRPTPNSRSSRDACIGRPRVPTLRYYRTKPANDTER